jgi:hypothetical protein
MTSTQGVRVVASNFDCNLDSEGLPAAWVDAQENPDHLHTYVCLRTGMLYQLADWILLMSMAFAFLVIYGTRRAQGQRDGIRSHCLSDFLATLCCMPCALSQMMRQAGMTGQLGYKLCSRDGGNADSLPVWRKFAAKDKSPKASRKDKSVPSPRTSEPRTPSTASIASPPAAPAASPRRGSRSLSLDQILRSPRGSRSSSRENKSPA